MRHLTTEELLLYAEGELSQPELCRHVSECVECKAQMVDLQEMYVTAAKAIRRHVRSQTVEPPRVQALQKRLAEEVDLLSAHLSAGDLLLSIEDELDPAGVAHLSRCSECQDRAANLHIQLAEIEFALRRQVDFALPEVRRAAALVALRKRLHKEVERQTVPAFSVRDWLPAFALPRIPAFASYSAAVVAACLVVWMGVEGIVPGPVPEPASIARTELPGVPPLALVVAEDPPDRMDLSGTGDSQPSPEQTPSPARFDWSADVDRRAPSAPANLAWAPAPVLKPGVHLDDSLLALDMPVGSALPAWLPDAATPTVPVPPARGGSSARAEGSVEAVVEGVWMLVQADLWNQDIRVGGSTGQVRFAGNVASERARLTIERALRRVANGRPVSFAISVLDSRPVSAVGQPTTASVLSQEPVGPVRNSLLEHYEDAARRSFQGLDRSLLEGELDRYVTRVLQHDTELLSHANALQGFLSQPGIEAVRDSDSFRKVLRFHLDAIWDHQAGIHDLLSEALSRRFWAYRSRLDDPGDTDSIEAEGTALRTDALALDRGLTDLLFGSSEARDAGASSPSINTLLKRLRQRTERLRAATKP